MNSNTFHDEITVNGKAFMVSARLLFCRSEQFWEVLDLTAKDEKDETVTDAETLKEIEKKVDAYANR